MTTQAPIEFKFTEKSVRVELDEHDNPWFCATDVCTILGYTNASKAIADHCKTPGVTKRYIGVVTGKTTEGKDAIQQIETTFINEGNLYRLIIKSRKPEAEKFESWVCDEVLPMIRKTGQYVHAVKETPKAEELATREQLAQLATLVHAIGMCFHHTDSARHACYAGIREQTGISQISELPSLQFNSVYGTMHLLHEKAQEYLKQRVAADKLVIKEVLRKHQLQLPLQADLFLPH